jgi:hypothetical protein
MASARRGVGLDQRTGARRLRLHGKQYEQHGE